MNADAGRAVVLGDPGFGLKTGAIRGFERSVNEYDCITLALITAIMEYMICSLGLDVIWLAYMKIRWF
jgi:hypothetical protein